MILNCNNYDCIHNQNYECSCKSIYIGDEYFAGCSEYTDYTLTEEYQQQYYARVVAETQLGFTEQAKAVVYGKKIEYNGRTFYTRDKVNDFGLYTLADARTGLLVCEFMELPQRWEKFIELEKNYPDVETLPLAEYKDGKYIIKEYEEE